MSQREATTKQEYLGELSRHPERGHTVIVRLNNGRSIPLDFFVEPLGDMAEPIQPGDGYDVIAQAPEGDYLLDIDIEDDCLRVWLVSSTGTFGKVFKEGVSKID